LSYAPGIFGQYSGDLCRAEIPQVGDAIAWFAVMVPLNQLDRLEAISKTPDAGS